MKIAARLTALAMVPLLAAGCASPQWQAANADCVTRYNVEIPADYQRMLVVRQQPTPMTGGFRCYPRGWGPGAPARCYPYNYWGYLPYSTWEMVDVNAERRDAAIRACTTATCINRFGNSSCDVPPPGGQFFGG